MKKQWNRGELKKEAILSKAEMQRCKLQLALCSCLTRLEKEDIVLINSLSSCFYFRLIISYTEDSSIAEWKGYLYATAMFAVIIIQSLVHHQHFRIMLTVGMRIHTCVIGLVYRKVSLLTNYMK